MQESDNDTSPEQIEDVEGFNPEIINDPSLSTHERNILLTELKNASDPPSGNGCLFILIPLIIGLIYLGYMMYDWVGSGLARLSLVPIAMVMAFLVKLWSDDREAGQAGYIMRKKDWRRPILYLRVFKTDGAPGIDTIQPSLHLGKVTKFKYSLEAEATNLLRDFGPIIGLAGSENEKYFGGPARLDRLSSNSWQDIVSALMKVSEAVVFVVSGHTTNLLWELQQGAKLLQPEDILFFVPQTTSPEERAAFSELIEKTLGIPLEVDPLQGSHFLMLKDNAYQPVEHKKELVYYFRGA